MTKQSVNEFIDKQQKGKVTRSQKTKIFKLFNNFMRTCEYYDPMPGFENRIQCRGEFRICNHCGKKICTLHSDISGHIVYGCKCKVCGKTIADGCKHDVPSWNESKLVEE